MREEQELKSLFESAYMYLSDFEVFVYHNQYEDIEGAEILVNRIKRVLMQLGVQDNSAETMVDVDNYLGQVLGILADLSSVLVRIKRDKLHQDLFVGVNELFCVMGEFYSVCGDYQDSPFFCQYYPQ